MSPHVSFPLFAVESSSNPLNINGNITILVPGDYYYDGYLFTTLTPGQVTAVFNLHVINGLYDFSTLMAAPVNTTYIVKHQKNPLEKQDKPGQVYLKSTRPAAGPRQKCEITSAIFAPDLYKGTNIIVHGFSCVLTPPNFPKGPYSTRLV